MLGGEATAGGTVWLPLAVTQYSFFPRVATETQLVSCQYINSINTFLGSVTITLTHLVIDCAINIY